MMDYPNIPDKHLSLLDALAEAYNDEDTYLKSSSQIFAACGHYRHVITTGHSSAKRGTHFGLFMGNLLEQGAKLCLRYTSGWVPDSCP